MSSYGISLVVPGQPISTERGFLKGHGTYLDGSTGESNDDFDGPLLIASVAGQIERVNKLISVKPAKSRYMGEVGDLVVGRISAIDSKRWKVDIRGWKVFNHRLKTSLLFSPLPPKTGCSFAALVRESSRWCSEDKNL
jgi:exosome complex RNA-binding protein Rrp4